MCFWRQPIYYRFIRKYPAFFGEIPSIIGQNPWVFMAPKRQKETKHLRFPHFRVEVLQIFHQAHQAKNKTWTWRGSTPPVHSGYNNPFHFMSGANTDLHELHWISLRRSLVHRSGWCFPRLHQERSLGTIQGSKVWGLKQGGRLKFSPADLAVEDVYILVNYSDRKRDRFPPKGRLRKGIPLISGKVRLVKYKNLARYIGWTKSITCVQYVCWVVVL